MANILFGWEIGENYGHLLGFLPTALALRDRGHTVHFVAHDLSRAARILDPRGFRYSQAPIWLPAMRHPRRMHTFADLLCHHGYLDAAGIEGMVRAWRWSLDAARADLVVADFSPTAQWAARWAGRPQMAFGTGYVNPPLTTPFPDLRWWRPVPDTQREAVEVRLLMSMNVAAAALGDARFSSVSELLAADERLLTTFTELDHYPRRDGGQFVGPRFSLDDGEPPRWPVGDGPRVFAYLQPGAGDFEAVCEALGRLDTPCIVHAPRLAANVRGRLESARLTFAPNPLRMRQVRDECALCVCHAGHGTVGAMLLAGKPLLLVPQHLEQEITARNVERIGAGIAVPPEGRRANYRQLLKRMLEKPSFITAAQSFARQHASHPDGVTAEEIADRCEALLQG